MENKTRALLSVALVAALCIADLAGPVLAEVVQPQQFPIDIAICGSSLVSIPGCLIEITVSILTGQFGHIGPKCCKEFTAIEDNCFPKMFPLIPFFPQLLKSSCSGTVGAPPSSM